VPDLVIFVGLQASGKTTFFLRHFQATHEHVSKDLFPNARNRDRRQAREIDAALAAFKSVVVATRTRPAITHGADRGGAPARASRGLFDRHGGLHRAQRSAWESRAYPRRVYTTAKKLEPPTPGKVSTNPPREIVDGFVVLPWGP
jgi:hypothetical protein